MNLKVMSIVTAVLLLVAVVGVLVDRRMGEGGSKGRVGSYVMENVDISTAGSIHVLSDEGEVTLKFVDGKWLVQEQDSFPAAAKKIQAFLFRINRSKIEHKVTENSDKLGGLGLLTQEENGGKLEKNKTATVFTIKDRSDKRIYQLLIGVDRRQQSGLRQMVGGQYIRFPEGPAAYLIPNPLFLERISKDWLRNRIFEFDHKKLFSGIRIRQPGKKDVVFSRKDAESPWRLAGVDGSLLDKDEVDDLIRRVGEIEVSLVASRDRSEKDLGRGRVAEIDIDLFDKRSYSMEIGLKTVDEEFQFVRIAAKLESSVEDEALKQAVAVFNDEFAKRRVGIYEWEAEQLIKTAKELLKKKDQ